MMNLLVLATCFEYFKLLTNIINMIYEAIKNRKKHKIDFFEYTKETFKEELSNYIFKEELINDIFNQELNNDTFNQEKKEKTFNQDQKKKKQFWHNLMENRQVGRSIRNSKLK